MNDLIRHAIERADLVTNAYDPAPAVGRYQGNGRFGAVFSKLGLHAHPRDQAAFDAHGKTRFTHLRHWGRFHFHSTYMQADTAADYLLPLARLYWEYSYANIRDYTQTQSFHDGTLTTAFTHGPASPSAGRVAVTSWFDPVRRNLSVLRFDVSGSAGSASAASPIIFAPEPTFSPYAYGYKDTARQTFLVTEDRARGEWVVEITCVTATPATVSRVHVRCAEARIEACAEGLRLTLAAGVNLLAISYGESVAPADVAASFDRTCNHWRALWQNSAWFDFPDDDSQRMWVRSVAYILSSFNDDGLGFTSTNGLTGNMFPFNFAQDLFYLHPVLLATGHVGVARSWIERFRELIPAMQAYAKHLWPEVEGIYPPWELPYGPIEGYHQPSVPIFYCYEPHNAAYLARMAHDTALALDDPQWTRDNAHPLLREIARFFLSFCRREADGRWHLFLTPSIGQDEAGGRNQKDYLCTLYGACYVLQKAVEHGLDADGACARILADGLAFESLLSPEGFYYASAGAGPKDFGRQKHPVQLNGLAYLPVDSAPQPPELTAHALRYATTERATEPYFFGWTLGEFLLASSRAGDAAGWRKDWANVLPSRYTDPDRVQLYETSGATVQSFYVTTHGLVAQSLAANIIDDYRGVLEIARTRVYGDAPVRFGNYRSVLGVTVDGELTATAAHLTLTAWKACTLTVGATCLTLAKGETRPLTLPLPRP